MAQRFDHPFEHSFRLRSAKLLILGLGLALGTLGFAAQDTEQADQNNGTNHSGHQCATPTHASRERVSIHSVTDGDTVVLNDRRKVRIIGINTAELSKKSERALKSEADEAKALIVTLATDADYITLVTGDEPKDRYGRVLAHLLLPDGRSLATELLARGLAAATAVGKNTRCASHYHRIESAARHQGRGLWQHRNNPWFGKDVSTQSIQGFHILQTSVESVTKKRTNWHIKLSNQVTVYANTKILSDEDANGLTHRDVEVRGWFGRRDGHVSVSLHHTSNLTILR